MSTIPKEPFRNIALCCSGGGYRATSFHLGTLSYLNRLKYKGKPLIENIKTVSTVSGGTITGVVYSMMKQKGKSFEEFYEFLIRQLREHDLVKESLDKIDNDSKWKNKLKRRNFINAFAELYDEGLTQGETFNIFYEGKSHVEEVIFNAIEFNDGINFRFQNYGVFGNNYHRIRKEAAKEVKLSDIIAASSCFPGGFEPISFPDDFLYSSSKELEQYQNDWESPVGLMDGGIYDNQGIESILLSESRRAEENGYDLILISDVSSPYMKSFDFYKEQKQEGFRTLTFSKILKSLKRSTNIVKYTLFVILGLGIVLSIVGNFSNNFLTGLGIGLTLLMIAILFIFYRSKSKIKQLANGAATFILDEVPSFYKSKFKTWNIKDYSIGRLEPMFFDRLSSLSILVGEVFLKQIRRLQYRKVYDNDNYKFRRISNLIKEYTESNYNRKAKRYLDLDGIPEVLKGTYNDIFGSKIKDVIEEASSFGTTLWFTSEDKINDVLNKLIACGQITICFNLLEYLVLLKYSPNNGYDNLSQENKDELELLYNQCLSDWGKFKKNPNFLLNSK